MTIDKQQAASGTCSIPFHKQNGTYSVIRTNGRKARVIPLYFVMTFLSEKYEEIKLRY